MAFVLGDTHANKIGTVANLHGFAIRMGHHCVMSAAEFFGVPVTARASLGV
jgi:cysteine desulfurase/selenocysteine lyase